MQLFNTLTHRPEPITTNDPDRTIRIYSCGPTVYDYAHIGNLSAYIFADTLRRTIQLAGFKVIHAMNYTDVDDKTIRRSQECYPSQEPLQALQTLTNQYIDTFLQDMRSIGNDVEALHFLRATDPAIITGMQQLITKLQQQGFAYITDDGIYFSIEAYQKSGKTYGQLLTLTTDNTSEARIQNDEYDKESVHDFALWKKQKEGEPAWEFTLEGQNLKGRPGWHIECSVMSRTALGQPFDIHTGGIDLIFPHHENEIAQSTAGEDDPVMARIFAHNEHILVDGKKMAKSAGNFYTLQDVMQKGFDPRAFRLLILQAHYRSQVHFSWENLEAAQNRLDNLRRMADLQFQATATEPWLAQSLHLSAIFEALQDDLNTPLALKALSALGTEVEERLIDTSESTTFTSMLQQLDAVLGLGLSTRSDITTDQKQLIADRQQARASQDWTKADELRDQLLEQCIGLRDTAAGAIWYRLPDHS